MSANSTERTSRGLARHMFEELDMLRNGKITPQQAKATASIANTICAVSRLEMDYARFVTSTRQEDEGELKKLTMG